MKKSTKFISLILAITLCVCTCIIPASAENNTERVIDKSKFETDYPSVYIYDSNTVLVSPIKEGYTFVEWQLNGIKYNFN